MPSTSPIDNFLGSGDALSRLQAHAGRLMRLQRQLEALLPDYMAAACKVANLKGEDLVIHVESAGLAVKLRQAVPTLLADFARAGVLLRALHLRLFGERGRTIAQRGDLKPAPCQRALQRGAHGGIIFNKQ